MIDKLQRALSTFPCLTVRSYDAADNDLPIAVLMNVCKQKDGVEHSATPESVSRMIRHLEHCDIDNDTIVISVGTDLIAFGWINQEQLNDGTTIFHINGWLSPQWRGQGIASAMMSIAESRCKELASSMTENNNIFIQIEPFESEQDLINLLKQFNFKPVRYETYMTRNFALHIPDIPLPEGFELRPVTSAHLRPIFDMSNVAFSDHWGAFTQSDEEYKNQLEDPDFRPELWKVAWHGDEIACVIHNFYDEAENNEYHRKRGYTEGICTAKKYRKKGLATALLAESMQMFSTMGFSETALSVDSENITGALGLYEKLGYIMEKRRTIYRKQISTD